MKLKFSLPILLTSLFATLSLIGGFFFVLPQLSTIDRAQRTLEQGIKLGSATKASATISPTLQNQVLVLLPPTADQYDLSVQIEALCKTSNVTISSLNFGATNPLPTTAPAAGSAALPAGVSPSVQVTLTVSGTYDNVKSLVNGLTALDRFIHITNLDITQTGANKASNSVSANIVANAFYQVSTVPVSPTPTTTP